MTPSYEIPIYDVAIIGMGPAGSMCARTLDTDKLHAIAFDRKPLDPLVEDAFHKNCGGLLAPDAQKALAELDLNVPKDVLVDPQIFSVATLDCATSIKRSYQRMYLNVDRQKFDCWLMSEASEGVELHAASVVTHIERTTLPDGAQGFALEYRRNDETETTKIFTRFVIGADGAYSTVRKLVYPHAKIRTYLSIQQWFAETHPLPFYACIFDPEITDCYSWGVSKDGYFIFGGAYPLKNARELLETQKEKLEKWGYRFGEVKKTLSCQVLRPQKWRDFYTGKNGALLVGEAAGFISASSLEGISSALKSGVLAAQAINEGDQSEAVNRRYHTATFRLRLKLLLKVFKCPFMYWPPLRAIIMKSGLNALKKRS